LLEPFSTTKVVDRAMLRGAHEPAGRVVRHAGLRPLLEGRDQRVLGQLLGEADITHDAGEAGDELGGLNPPDSVDRSMNVGRCHDPAPLMLSEAKHPRPRGTDSSASVSE